LGMPPNNVPPPLIAEGKTGPGHEVKSVTRPRNRSRNSAAKGVKLGLMMGSRQENWEKNVERCTG